MSLTADRLRQVLHYTPETGVFTWRERISIRIKAIGDVAGARDGDGYNLIGIDGCKHRANRLAWLYMTGSWPVGHVDHENRNTSDDRWLNLRDISKVHNQQNSTEAQATSKTGLKGATFHPLSGLYYASITVDKVRRSLGYHATAALASQAYFNAKKQMHPGYAHRPCLENAPNPPPTSENSLCSPVNGGVADGARTDATGTPEVPA